MSTIASQGAPTNAMNFNYTEFGNWYDRYRLAVLEPALEVASSTIDYELLDVLSERDLARLHNAHGRVKSKRRLWRKLQQPRYRDRVSTLEDIPLVIDDLVGLRITCTNLRDIEMVQAALDHLPDVVPSKPSGGALWLDNTSERDYVVEPKPSGYRGWHVNLGTRVQLEEQWVTVSCELQVRTLLQDSWGELTHEDTYSKDGALPPLVEVLSKRMADLFATLDDIAEDLRTELDRIDEATVASTPDINLSDEPRLDKPGEQAADAEAFLLEQWKSIDRPTDLAVLAWAVQREFGAEVSDGWFGYDTFKRFVHAAIPSAAISTGRHAFLLPEGAEVDDEEPAERERSLSPEAPVPADATALPGDTALAGDTVPTGEMASADRTDDSAPEAAEALRRVDRGFPMLDSSQWQRLFGTLAATWLEAGHIAGTPTSVNQLAKNARDRNSASEYQVSRRHLAYVARAVLDPDGNNPPQTAAQIADQFATLTLQRMAELRIVGARNRKARAVVRAWLGG